ncbi:hypothetical protein LMG28688_04322 [Paraburkholderia caffeinitolerans]|uniref:AsmA domain-containing protein n=1 Tax=Paraburkholderia caffeinitolerans TaxID=1723730 RepID=A0A6J5GAP6_9BURK|nr:DUF748 domain-containing protein [Paraburkholderia caffeinitolerans]CAB3796498.1 hypothetical protein LMG28688_04322 [Paraburkholderia caffeinitolerans]
MASLNKESLTTSLQSVRAVARAPRTRRIFTGIAIFLVVFGLLGFFAAPPLIRHIAEQQLSKQLDRPVSIAHIGLNPYTLRLEADRVHIGERGGQGDFFDVEKLVVQASWSSIFRAAPIVDEVRLDSPRATIVRLDAQRFNFSDLVEKFSKPSEKPSSKPAQFAVSNIHIENGKITFDDRLLNEKHVIDRWSLGIPFIATLPSKTDIFVQPMLRARIDGDSTLAIDGKTKPFAASRESEVELRLADLDLPKLLTYAPTKLPVTLKSGKLSTNLKLDFVMSGEKPTLRVSGTTDLNDIDATDNANAPLFGARSLHVAAASLEPFSNVYRFDTIRIDAPKAWIARDKAGVLSVEKLAGAPAAKAEAAKSNATAPSPGKGAASAVAAVPPAASGAQAESAAETKAPPLDLSIRQFAIVDGTVHVHDEAASRPVELDLDNVTTTLANFSTVAKAPADYTLAFGAPDGGTAQVSGRFGLAAKNADAKVVLHNLTLPQVQPYLDGVSAAQILDGKLSLDSTIKADWAQEPAAVKVEASTLNLEALKLAARGSKAPIVALAKGTVQVSAVDLAARTAQIASVDTSGLAVNVERKKDGKIDLLELAQGRQAAPERTAIRAAQKSVKEGPAWRYKIDALNVNGGSINFTDSTTPRPVTLAVAPLDLKVQQISDDMKHALPIDLKATINKKGTLALSGDLNPTPLTAKFKIDANRLDAAAFEPYFGSQLNAVIASALLNMKGQLAVEQGKALKANYRGDAALVDVRMLDKATSDPFAGWRSLALSNLKASYDDARGTDVDASRVTFSGFYGRVLLDAQGKLNLKDVVAHESGQAQSLTRDTSGHEPVPLSPQAASAPVAAASAPAPASAPATVTAAQPPKHPVRLHFGELVLQNGRVTYTDNFIKPNYSANLVQIQGTVGAFGTESTTSAPVDVSAKLAANGPIAIKGSVNPLIAKPALDITASAHDIELTNLTPYSAKYAGYPITKGKLNVDLHYQLANDQLSANNHIFIDQLTFGDHVENDTATKLPVRLAISLLKNRRGEIDVNIPVSGSLSNPEFSLGGLIWKAVLNLIAKAVTAPFTLLANAFGGGGEELGYVEFPAGSAELSDADNKKLDTIAKALDDKPSIKIDLIGRVDPAVDTPALREKYVDRLVRRQKVKDTVGNGESVDISQVQVDPKEYEKYLTKAYKDADFKKPRNMVGLTKTLPVDDMKQALADHAPVDDATLRDLAQRRAQAVQQYFEGKVDSSRVFVVAPKLDAKGIDDKGATTRVDFGLK